MAAVHLHAAVPLTISGQVDMAEGWRDAWEHEARNARGEWAKTPGSGEQEQSGPASGHPAKAA